MDYSTSTYGFQELSYAGDAVPVDVYIDGEENIGDIQQGPITIDIDRYYSETYYFDLSMRNSYDALINVATAMDTISNPLGGLSIVGTSGDDYFSVSSKIGQ
ncbi:hypothetical protein SAMN04488092_107149 [Thalassovita taeanensis]|uniref:Uncharacterized protein n=1 Tax=Thalassovita taeanensis TaxID=657014 RepID=A0A1H9GEP1_9RHOB|nr:hypothetical protein SAMN04488092_107149 [Thalassovita taeanensis]